MIGALARKFFGSANDRRVKGYQSRVNAINALEPELAALSDEALKARTAEFRQQLADGKTLDDLLVPAFATVREAAKRTLGQRHFDVQLIGGMVLHEGDIAEMKTGEGKTLVATLAVYLNALAGKGVHVVTVNDYLAKRDSEWMGQIYGFLGMTTGVIYFGLLLNHFVALRNLPAGLQWLLLGLLLTWITDTGAYFSGRGLGKHKLWPRHSPKKTWEGAIGGWLVGTAAGALLGPWLVGQSPWAGAALGGLVCLVAPFGDLAESMVKRQMGAKDSGHLIPGHGGMWDRIDSLLFVIPVVYYWAFLIGAR